MVEAIRLSNLYPIFPIMHLVAIFLCLMLLPGFWRTRIVALVALVSWLAIGNVLYFIGMIQWRGNVNDLPVWASILTFLGRLHFNGVFASMGCFAHFSWQRLRPVSIRHLYDTRRRNNWIHIFFTLILPLIWTPLAIFSCPWRYVLLEDFGPVLSSRYDWPGFVFLRLPQLLGCATVGIFNILALVGYWRSKREEIDADLSKHHASVRTRKLLIMALINTPLAAFGVYNQVITMAKAPWYPRKSLAENIAALQIVIKATRLVLETEWTETARSRSITILFGPLLAFYVFACFGFGEEARKSYVEATMNVVRLVATTIKAHRPRTHSMPFSWSLITLAKFNVPRCQPDPLPLVHLNMPTITPYISTGPRDNSPAQPTSPARIHSPNPIGNAIDIKRQVIVTPPIPIRRPSYHKPPFIPLNSNIIPLAPDALGSIPSRMDDVANTRRKGNSSPHPRTRRLSYHKPPFVPLRPAQAPDDDLRMAVPLVEVSRVPAMHMNNTELITPSIIEDSMVSPAVITPASTAPPSLSTESLRTPAPPYQASNPFLGHTA